MTSPFPTAVEWLQRRPSRTVAIAGALVILVPVLVFGPWLPLIDLVAFVGMDSYPPALSYGPFHYSVFQFTYFGHYLISRLLVDLGLPIRFQIPFFYLVQAGAAFAVIWRVLERIVADPWLRAVGVALGVLAYWDGVFLWGGPLAYSLAAGAMTVATFLAFRGVAEPEKDAWLPLTLVIAFAILCHPFAIPFAGVLCLVRWLFNRRRRWQTVALGLGVLAYAFVILRDSPTSEATASHELRRLFGLDAGEIKERLVGLFVQDAGFVQTLYGTVPLSARIVFLLFAVVHVVGFLLSPWLAWRARDRVWLRMLATLNTATAVLYLFSFDLPTAPIPEWPQRILTLYSAFTFLTGFGGIVYLSETWVDRWRGQRQRRAYWLVPIGFLLLAGWAECRVFRFSGKLERGIDQAREDLLQTGVSGAYVVVSSVDSIRPFYLRCVPFVLFSDPAVVARHILVGTEWHFKARHPTRIAEASLESGRKRYLAEFSSTPSRISVSLVPQPEDRFPIIEGTNVFRWGNPVDLANDQRAQAIELYENGAFLPAAKHFNTAVHLLPNDARPRIDAGVAFYNAGQLPAAAAQFRRALQLAPDNADANADYAAVLLGQGLVAEAEAHWRRALELDPHNERANRLRDRIERARASANVGVSPVAR